MKLYRDFIFSLCAGYTMVSAKDNHRKLTYFMRYAQTTNDQPPYVTGYYSVMVDYQDHYPGFLRPSARGMSYCAADEMTLPNAQCYTWLNASSSLLVAPYLIPREYLEGWVTAQGWARNSQRINMTKLKGYMYNMPVR